MNPNFQGKESSWEVYISPIGRGGNAQVYKCKKKSESGEKKFYALKKLNKRHLGTRKETRFAGEITCTLNAQKFTNGGILEILDYQLVEKKKFYVMPLATPIKDISMGFDISRTLEAIFEYSRTLIILHNKDIYHRDIKPENLFYLNEKFLIGDFGLVKAPFLESVSLDDERIGPAFYIAPEMLNNAKNSNGIKADVYSLAKTMWVLLTKQNYPIPGEHKPGSVYSLKKLLKISEELANKLDAILYYSTIENPEGRLTMSEFNKQLGYIMNPESIESKEQDLTRIAKKIEAKYLNDSLHRDHYLEQSELSKKIAENVKGAIQDIYQNLTKAFDSDIIKISYQQLHSVLKDNLFPTENDTKGNCTSFSNSSCIIIQNSSLEDVKMMFVGIAWDLKMDNQIEIQSTILCGSTTSKLDRYFESEIYSTKLNLPEMSNVFEQLGTGLNTESGQALSTYFSIGD